MGQGVPASAVGAWKQRFEQARADEKAAAAKAAEEKAAADKAAAASAPALAQGVAAVGAPAAPAPAAVSAEREAFAAAEEADIKAKIAALGKDATPEQKANAVGVRPAGLAAARNGNADDLKRIKGIGPVNEGKLNALGIFHFDQIAAWSRQEIRWVGAYLSFPGRIDREDWTGQAGPLARGEDTEFSKRVDAGQVPSSAGGPSRPDMKK